MMVESVVREAQMKILLELLEFEPFCHNQDFLAVLIWAKDLGPITNNEYTKVGIEEANKVFGVAHDVSGRVAFSRNG